MIASPWVWVCFVGCDDEGAAAPLVSEPKNLRTLALMNALDGSGVGTADGWAVGDADGEIVGFPLPAGVLIASEAAVANE